MTPYLKMFLIVVSALVVVPGIILLGILLLPPGAQSFHLAMRSSYYFIPPARIFGEPHFTMGIGVGPNDSFGFMLTFGFYTIVSLIVTSAVVVIRK
jgi:hypothetical protein